MNERNYKEKYHEYLMRNKLLLKQLRRYDDIQEQKVKFIAITISQMNDEKETQILNKIINIDDNNNLHVLRTLNYIVNKHLKYKKVKKEHYETHNIIETKYNGLMEEMNLLLAMIRGNNNILQFDLSYITSHEVYEKYTKISKTKKIYILELLPPTKDSENLYLNYQNCDFPEKSLIPWNVEEHNDVSTLQHKWLSSNCSWKYDAVNKVWLTNDPRPWYFENFPSNNYVKSINEWNVILEEVSEHEKEKKRILLNEKTKQEKIIKKDSSSLYDIIKGFLFQNNKVYITNEQDNVTEDLTEKSF